MISYILFCIIWLFLQLFRVVPFPVVQAISRAAYLLCFYVVRYRRKVVGENLRNSFPEKTEKEIYTMSKKFYCYFCDLLTETIKGYTMSSASLNKRFRAENPELTDSFFEQGKSVIMIGGHYGNHEWGKILGRQLKHPFFVIYTTFSNPYIEAYQQRTRTKYGMKILPVLKTLRCMMERRNEAWGYIMGVDQRPYDLKNSLWVRFLNQDTPCHTGYEQLARKFNIPVVYLDIRPVKRGYYTLRTILISDNPAKMPEGAIVKTFMRLLQDSIIARPEYWLWSHKRWRYKKPEGTVVHSLDN